MVFEYSKVFEQYEHARIQKVLSEGSNFFLVDDGREDPKTTKSGPSSARHRNAVWRFAGRPMMAKQ